MDFSRERDLQFFIILQLCATPGGVTLRKRCRGECRLEWGTKRGSTKGKEAEK